MKYMESMEEYNANIDRPVETQKVGKYRRGSLAQKIFEPMVGAIQDSNGCYHLEIEEFEISNLDEESLRKQYETAKNLTNEVYDMDAESDEFTEKLFADL